MAPRPFGYIQRRHHTESEKDRREEERQARRFDLEQLFKAQNLRVKATLKGHTDRVNRARWGTDYNGDGLFAVTRHGTCEVSSPVKREYQRQERSQ
jgi:hypothetical protein